MRGLQAAGLACKGTKNRQPEETRSSLHACADTHKVEPRLAQRVPRAYRWPAGHRLVQLRRVAQQCCSQRSLISTFRSVEIRKGLSAPWIAPISAWLKKRSRHPSSSRVPKRLLAARRDGGRRCWLAYCARRQVATSFGVLMRQIVGAAGREAFRGAGSRAGPSTCPRPPSWELGA